MPQKVSYSSVYTKLWNESCSKKDKYIDIGNFFKNANTNRELFWITKYLLIVYRTQYIGKFISKKDVIYLEEKHRLSSIKNKLALRKLQHKIIERLWRPNGPIHKKLNVGHNKFFNHGTSSTSSVTS